MASKEKNTKKQFRINIVESLPISASKRNYRICFYRDESPSERYINEDLILSDKGTARLLKGLHTRLSDDSIRHEWFKGNPDDTLSGTLGDKVFQYEPAFKANLKDNGELDVPSMEADEQYVKKQDANYHISQQRKDYSKYFFENYTDIVKKNEARPSELKEKLFEHMDKSKPHANPFDDQAEDNKIISKYEATHAKKQAPAKKPQNSLLNDLNNVVNDSKTANVKSVAKHKTNTTGLSR